MLCWARETSRSGRRRLEDEAGVEPRERVLQGGTPPAQRSEWDGFEALRSRTTAAPGEGEALRSRTTAAPGEGEALRSRTTAASSEAEALRSRTTAAPGEAEALRSRTMAASGKAEALRSRTTAAPGEAEALRSRTIDWRQLFLLVRDNYSCRSRPWFEGLPRRPRGGSSGWGSWWVA